MAKIRYKPRKETGVASNMALYPTKLKLKREKKLSTSHWSTSAFTKVWGAINRPHKENNGRKTNGL